MSYQPSGQQDLQHRPSAPTVDDYDQAANFNQQSANKPQPQPQAYQQEHLQQYPPTQPVPAYSTHQNSGYSQQQSGPYPPQQNFGSPNQTFSQYPPQPATGYPSQNTRSSIQQVPGYTQPPPSYAYPSKSSAYPPPQPVGYQPQPVGYPLQTVGYPPTFQAHTVFPPNPTVIVHPTSFGTCSTSCFCAKCQTTVITRCEYSNSSQAWTICMVLFILGFCFLLPWFLCWLPFCMEGMKTVTHRCPHCGSHLGTYQGGSKM